MMSREGVGKEGVPSGSTHDFKLDPRANPKRITISRHADDRWTVIYGTYQLQGDHLRILTFKAGEPVPADFAKPTIVHTRQSPRKGEATPPPAKPESAIDQAQAFLKKAEERVEWARRMLAKGYVSQAQVRADEETLQRAKAALEQAETRHEPPDKPDVAPSVPRPSQPKPLEEPKPASIRELELRLKLARTELERYEALYQRQSVPLSVVTEMRQKLAILEAQLDAAKERLNNAKSLPEEPKPTGMSLKELEVRLKFARQELERYEQLYKNNAVPLNIVEEMRLKVAILEARLDATKERLVAAKPTPDNPQTSSAPSPDRPAFQGLENRLKRAQRVLAAMKKLSNEGSVSMSQVEKAGADVDAVIEEIETQDESLADDLELLEAQKLRKEAELRVAEAQYRPGSSLMKMTNEEAKAQIDVKKAELLEVEVRIKQCKRKRDQIERLKKEVEPAK